MIRKTLVAALVAALFGCEVRGVGSKIVLPEICIVVGAGTTQPVVLQVVDEAGRGVNGVRVRWNLVPAGRDFSIDTLESTTTQSSNRLLAIEGIAQVNVGAEVGADGGAVLTASIAEGTLTDAALQLSTSDPCR